MGIQVEDGPVQVDHLGSIVAYGYGDSGAQREYWMHAPGVAFPLSFDFSLTFLKDPGNLDGNEAAIIAHLTQLARGMPGPILTQLEYEAKKWVGGSGKTFEIHDGSERLVGVWTSRITGDGIHREAAMVLQSHGAYPFDENASFEIVPADPFFGVDDRAGLEAAMETYLRASGVDPNRRVFEVLKVTEE